MLPDSLRAGMITETVRAVTGAGREARATQNTVRQKQLKIGANQRLATDSNPKQRIGSNSRGWRKSGLQSASCRRF